MQYEITVVSDCSNLEKAKETFRLATERANEKDTFVYAEMRKVGSDIWLTATFYEGG